MGKYFVFLSFISVLIVQVVASDDCPISASIEQKYKSTKVALSKHLTKLIEAQKDLKNLHDEQVKYDSTWLEFSVAQNNLKQAQASESDCVTNRRWGCKNTRKKEVADAWQAYNIKHSSYETAKNRLSEFLAPVNDKYCKLSDQGVLGNYYDEVMFSNNHGSGTLKSSRDSVLSVFQSPEWYAHNKRGLLAEDPNHVSVHPPLRNIKSKFDYSWRAYVFLDNKSQKLLSKEDLLFFEKIAGLVTVPRTRALIDDYIDITKEYNQVRAVQKFCKETTAVNNPNPIRTISDDRSRKPKAAGETTHETLEPQPKGATTSN